jgi:aminopeptidase YwaD
MLIDHLRMLTESIGERPIGSQANHHAAQYIEDIFSKVGFSIQKQIFNCPDWVGVSAEISIGDKTLTALPNTFSPSCEITAGIATASSLEELEKIQGTHKVIVLYGELTEFPIVQKGNKVYNPERDQKINTLLEQKQPSAVITVSSLENDILPLINDWEVSFPSATVPASAGEWLINLQENQAHIVIETTSIQSSGWNVIGRKMGSSRDRIVVCAHFDSYHRTPGAFDNATGVAVMLTIAEWASRENFPFDIEFIAFNGEEYYAMGDLEYMKEADFGSILCAINIDGVGPKNGSNTITMMAASDEFQIQIKDLLKEETGIKWTDPWYAGNHTTFLMRGVPSIALSSKGLEHICHLPSDTMETIDPIKVEEVAKYVENIIRLIAEQSTTGKRIRE